MITIFGILIIAFIYLLIAFSNQIIEDAKNALNVIIEEENEKQNKRMERKFAKKEIDAEKMWRKAEDEIDREIIE